MIPPSLRAYVRSQEIGPAIGNMICNPFLAWLGNRRLEPMTLFGEHSIILDTAITAIIASLLVTLFAVSGVHRDLKAGRISIPKDLPQTKNLRSRLPRSTWSLGLTLGLSMAIVMCALAWMGFHLLSVSEITFRTFLVVKTIYTTILGAFVARQVVLRKLTPDPHQAHPLPMRNEG